MKLTNQTSKTVKLYWLDQNGNRAQLEGLDENGNRRPVDHFLKPNESITVDTWVTHPHVLTTLDGECLAVYLPTAEPSEAILRDGPNG